MMAATITIAPMRHWHLRDVHSIDAKVYPRPWSLALWRQEIAMLDTRYYIVAESDGNVVGHAGIMYVLNEGHVTTVAVDPPAGVLRRLRAGVELDDGPTAPAGVRLAAPGKVEITIHEGRNRQVRRMLAAVGYPARALHRSGYAGLELGDLRPGEWRKLADAEVEALRDA